MCQLFEWGEQAPDLPISFKRSAWCCDDPFYSEILNLKHNKLICYYDISNLNNQLLYTTTIRDKCCTAYFTHTHIRHDHL